jgi:hypothetical protein
MEHDRGMRFSPRWWRVSGAVVAGVLLVGSPGAGAELSAQDTTDPIETPEPPVTLCHAVGDLQWNLLTVAASSAVGGHAPHPGDIVPPVAYEQGGESIVFPGSNLGPLLPDGTAGQEILDAGCVVTQPPEITTTTPPTTAGPGTSEATTTTPPTTAGPGTSEATTTTVEAVPPTIEFRCAEGEIQWAGKCYVTPDIGLPTIPTDPVDPEISIPIVEPPDPGTLRPVVNCVETDGTVNTAWFGYEYDADQPVFIRRGPNNVVEPAGTPPVLFSPGSHVYMFSVTGSGTTASWQLNGEIAIADDWSPRCGDVVEPPEPPTTEPGDPGESACPDGQADVDGECSEVAPLELVLLDNTIECNGAGTALFAAHNPNDFQIDGSNATSMLSPRLLEERLEAPTFTPADPELEGRVVSGTFKVEYVSAVTWTVSHHGYTPSVSAGARTARVLGDCENAVAAVAGISGVDRQLAETGIDLDYAPWAVAFVTVGAFLVLVSRRPATRARGQ